MARLRLSVLMIVPTLLTTGCMGSTGGGARPGAVAASASIVPMAAAAYFALASSIDLFEIRSAQMALERSADQRNRTIAQSAIESANGTSAQLSMAGRRLDMLPSATLLPEQQLLLDQLAASNNFDETYRTQQLRVNREAVKLHGDFAKGGQSPTLRPVARNAEEVYRRNLTMVGAGH